MNHRSKPAPPPEEQGERAPLWIISFADMISLLMAFFVMLMTMSTARSGKLCNEGEGIFERTLYGFRRSIEGFGIPGLFGSANDLISFDSTKVYYPIPEGGESGAARTIDATEERLRREFLGLQRHTKTYEAQLQGRNPNFLALPITFAAGQSVLDEPARQVLGRFLADLKGFGPAEGLDLYVVGLAPDEPDPQRQWLVSARRAHHAAQFLRDGLPAGTPWRIFSWGAAAGGEWVKKDSPVSPQAHLAIATLRRSDAAQ